MQEKSMAGKARLREVANRLGGLLIRLESNVHWIFQRSLPVGGINQSSDTKNIKEYRQAHPRLVCLDQL
jgi:hypothetical protein